MSIFIAFIIGIICGFILCGALECVYCLGQQKGRELATAQKTDARQREWRQRECCGGAHPPPPPPPSAHLSPSAPSRGGRAGRR